MADGVASFIDRTAPIKSSLLELQKQPPISIQSTSDEARKRTFQLHLLRTKRLNFHTGLRHSFVSAKREPKPQTKRNKKMATAEIDSSSSTSGSSAVVAAVNAPAPFFLVLPSHSDYSSSNRPTPTRPDCSLRNRKHAEVARFPQSIRRRRFTGEFFFSFFVPTAPRVVSRRPLFCFVSCFACFFSFRAVPPREPHRNRVSNTPTRQ